MNIPKTCGGCICCESNPIEDICTAADEITKFVNSPPSWCPIKPVWCTTGFYTQAIESRQIESASAITERGRFKVCQEIGENLLKGGFIDFEEYDLSSAGEIVTKGTVMFIPPAEREWLEKELLEGGVPDEEGKG